MYRLIEGRYERQQGEPVWMPEIGLGIGREQGVFEGWEQEWLYWYSPEGSRFEPPERQLEQAAAQLVQERQLREELISRLGEKGINPDAL